MKKLYISLALIIIAAIVTAQSICNPAGNLMIYTNYDGGTLNINVNQNIPNLKIGIVSYEAMTVNLSGTYVNNVSAVSYAGINSLNSTNCGASIPTTTINGAPSGAQVTILTAPATPHPHPNGYGYDYIICGISCDTSTWQGGCNTIDEIEGYFLDYFPGSVLFAHNVQYGCWTGTQNLSNGGTCCLTMVGIKNNTKVNAINVYPNPANDIITVSAGIKLSDAAYTISNMMGATVLKGTLLNENTTINIGSLTPGVYVLKIGDLYYKTFEVSAR